VTQLNWQLDPPPRRRGLGAAVSNPLANLTPQQQAQISQIAQLSGIDPQTALGTINAINNYGAPVIGALTAVQNGNGQAAVTAAIPLVAGAVSLIASPVAGAIVAAGLSGGVALLTQLGLFQQASETCSWKAPPTDSGSRGVCFTGSERPYGPLDPSWLTLDAFASTTRGTPNLAWKDVYWTDGPNSQGWLTDFIGTGAGAGFSPGQALGLELYALGDQGQVAAWANNFYTWYGSGARPTNEIDNGPWRLTTPGLRAFGLAFDRAYCHSLEYMLNGFAPVNAATLLQFVVQAWNTKYPTGNPVSIDGTMGSFADFVWLGKADAWATNNPVAQRSGVVIVNDPPLGTLVAANLPAATPSSSVNPVVVAAGAVGAAAVGTAVLGFIGRQGASAVVSGALSSIAKALTGLPFLP
jgi:hypothetical protein